MNIENGVHRNVSKYWGGGGGVVKYSCNINPDTILTLFTIYCRFLCISICLSICYYWMSQLNVKNIYFRTLSPVFLAATKQLYEWYFLSVFLSVCPSVRHTFLTMFPSSYHHEIFRSYHQDQGNVHAKGQGQRSKVKVTEVTTQLSRFRTVTPVWIHIWWWNDTYSLMLFRRGALLFFKVIRQISRSHGAKNRQIWPRLGISGL